MRILPSMTQIKDGKSMATLCVHVCCVHAEKKALGADLLKELITGGKAALVTLACGLTGARVTCGAKAATLVSAHFEHTSP